MNPTPYRLGAAFSFVVLGSSLMAATGKVPASDIIGPEKRRPTVEMAGHFTKPTTPPPLPKDLALPFGPPNFEQTDAEERAASVAVAAKNPQTPKQSSDRDTLARIAQMVTPRGTMFTPSGEPMLTFGTKLVKIGTHFTVTVSGQDYDLELVSIDRTTYTLRLNREEITRPISPRKSP